MCMYMYVHICMYTCIYVYVCGSGNQTKGSYTTDRHHTPTLFRFGFTLFICFLEM